MKILYLQQDYLNTKELKKWDFSRHLGIAYSLRLSGAEVQTIMIPHLNKFKNALKNSTYDVCVVNDVIHGLCMDSPNLKSLTQDDVLYLKSKSKIMLGFVNEQLSSYLDEQSQSNDLAKEQISKFEKVQNLFDCFAISHLSDINYFNKIHKRVIWQAPWIPSDFNLKIKKDFEKSSPDKYCFTEVELENNKTFLDKENIHNLIHLKFNEHDEIYWNGYLKILQDFNQENLLISTQFYQENYIDKLSEIRILAAVNYIEVISNFKALVELPTNSKAWRNGVLESLCAGVPCVTPINRNPKNNYYVNGEDLLTYSSSQVHSLREVLNFINQNETFCVDMVNGGRQKSSIYRSELAFSKGIISFLEEVLYLKAQKKNHNITNENDQVDLVINKYNSLYFIEQLKKNNYFLKKNYSSRVEINYYEDVAVDSTVTWQPDVYQLAGFLALEKNVEYLIDVGCGKGKKLNQLQEQTGIKTIGIDYGANIHECVTNFPDKIWIEKNIESEELFDLDLNYKNCGIIFSDVIEHLLEPEIVLFQFKKIIEKVQFIIISTPERDRERGGNDFGPPKNETHVREWSINELRDLYKLFNLPIILHGLTRNNDVENRLTTIITVFSKTINLGIDPQYKHALYFDESNKPCYTYID